MDMQSIKEKLAELGPRVAAFVSRDRRPRALTDAEKRLALDDPAKFNDLAKAIQDDTLTDMRAEAAYQVLQDDLAAAEAAERAKEMEVARAEREELLALRAEASQAVEAALADADDAIVHLQELSAKIARLDRACGEPDANRASHGIITLGLKRTIQNKAPNLHRVLFGGMRFLEGAKDRGLSEMLTPAGYNFGARHGDQLAPDPFE